MRSSRRYPGYLRVHNVAYCKCLVRLLKDEAADLVEAFGMESAIAVSENDSKNLEATRQRRGFTGSILEHLGVRSPLKVSADEFNSAAEEFTGHLSARSTSRKGST